MDPSQLWETTMKPKSRRVIQVKESDGEMDPNLLFELLGGGSSLFRKEFLMKYTAMSEVN